MWFRTVTWWELTVRDDETLGRTPLIGHDGGQTDRQTDWLTAGSVPLPISDRSSSIALCRSDGTERIRTDPETERAPSASRDQCYNF